MWSRRARPLHSERILRIDNEEEEANSCERTHGDSDIVAPPIRRGGLAESLEPGFAIEAATQGTLKEVGPTVVGIAGTRAVHYARLLASYPRKVHKQEAARSKVPGRLVVVSRE